MKLKSKALLQVNLPEKLFFCCQVMNNFNNFYSAPNHTNLIVNVHICCLALLTIVVVNYGCLETNHDDVNIIIELILCKTWKNHYYFFDFHVEVKIQSQCHQCLQMQ